MNDLNSVLIEGVIHVPPKFFNNGQKFVIASNWFKKTENGFEKEVNLFVFAVYGKLAQEILAKGEQGRRVRVVGRMKQKKEKDEIPKFIIIAEHVELKPNFETEVENND
jgi:single-stranded DNA-binding protein